MMFQGAFQHVRQKLNQFENVAAGTTARVALPMGSTFLDSEIEFTGVTLAEMTEIRVLINQDVRHRYSGTELDKVLQYNGFPNATATTPGFLTVPYGRFGLKTLGNEVITALQTGDTDPETGQVITSIEIEIDIAGTAAAPNFTLYNNTSSPVGQGPGLILSYYRQTIPWNFDGEIEVDDLLTRNGMRSDPRRLAVSRHYLFIDKTKLERIRVRRNQYDIYDHSVASQEREAGRNGFVPQSGLFVIDPLARGYGGNPFDVASPDLRDYRLVLKNIAGQTITNLTVLTEFVGRVAQ